MTGKNLWKINILGSGIAGLTAAITLAEKNIPCNLISLMPGERAQSVLAAGGINAVLNTMEEGDTFENHFKDTMAAGGNIADPEAVWNLVNYAPQVIDFLRKKAVPFNIENGSIQQRNFGGQKKKRTCYAKSSTGKMIMSALISECRKYEAKSLISRFSHHSFVKMLRDNEKNVCRGLIVKDTYTKKILIFYGPLIMCSGGLNGFFPGLTTGTTLNSGDAAAELFFSGVKFSNLEMIQFHPTSYKIPGKCCLISEAARGEGGRLFIFRDNKPFYFLEEKYGRDGNLKSRDVVSREIFNISSLYKTSVYMDMTCVKKEVWKNKLSDLRAEIIYYLKKDPCYDYIPVSPAIHYFMGGIDVDIYHACNLLNLYAAGECASQYHGANRLGANSLLGAFYGGRVAALSASSRLDAFDSSFSPGNLLEENNFDFSEKEKSQLNKKIASIIFPPLNIIRSEETLQSALKELDMLEGDFKRINFAKAMLLSAAFRKESRGAHFRRDFPESCENYRGKSLASYSAGGGILVEMKKI